MQLLSLSLWLPERLATWRETTAKDVQLEIATDLPPVRAQSVLLGQLLDNLVDNAGKYSPSGSTFTVQARRAGAQVEISVTDEGPGLSPEDQAHLFEPFYRGETARTLGIRGTGLGLAIATRLATALDGSLQLGEGTKLGARLLLSLQCGRS